MGNVVNLKQWRDKKLKEFLAATDHYEPERPTLYVNSQTGKASGSPNDNFGNRLSNVKESLDKIQTLMKELRRLNNANTRSN